MDSFYGEFLSLLDEGNKERCVNLCLVKLSEHTLDVVTLYQDILAPALREKFCRSRDEEICIWQEHIRTSIVRTIIECCYPFVLRERDEKYLSTRKGKVVVLCPPDEAHEIGARMVADFFLLNGFDVTFIGASTPGSEIIGAITHFKPEYVAISITNVFNLIVTAKAIGKILDLKKTLDFEVILGGQACKHNPTTCQKMNADMILDTFDDIQKLAAGGSDASV
jgi:methanogenic corrinoid protein MtbC1